MKNTNNRIEMKLMLTIAAATIIWSTAGRASIMGPEQVINCPPGYYEISGGRCGAVYIPTEPVLRLRERRSE